MKCISAAYVHLPPLFGLYFVCTSCVFIDACAAMFAASGAAGHACLLQQRGQDVARGYRSPGMGYAVCAQLVGSVCA